MKGCWDKTLMIINMMYEGAIMSVKTKKKSCMDPRPCRVGNRQTRLSLTCHMCWTRK